jgi:hypothetical protein
MASLTGQLVAETYKALLKTIDNDILTASEKQITDGFGGGSNVFIDSQGFLRANKYKVTNGLATQFLKADGSLDSNTYLTGITSSQIITALGYTPVTNARTLTINGTTYDLSANRSWTIAGTAAIWGNISGTLSNQTDLQNALNAKYNNPTGTISQYIRGDGTIANFPSIAGGLPTGGTAGQILAKIDATDYNAHWIDNYATQTKNEVKLGQTLTKGTAVYVSSANGTNMIVSAASNASEATSSKTLGLLETGGATNDLVKCVTFGLLAGLDTSTATAGDPVWLGVNGALIFGLANKPYAPAHLVYIGVVTRVQSNNGEIFVNVQNGFELKEIHDVYIADPANNHGLFYDLADGLWKNKSIASALGYTPQAQLSGTGFVKASGTSITYDNSTYLTTTDAASTYQRLDKMVSNLLASATEYPNSNAVIAALALKANAENPVFTGNMTISGAEPKLYFTDTDQNPDYFIGADAGFFRIYDQTAGATRFVINSSGVTTIAGDLIVGTIAKSGGTATQFLKADGSIDSSTYVTSASLANYLLISTAASTYQRLDKMVSNLLASDTEYPNSNAVLAKLALKADAANPVFTGDMTISGIAPKLYFTDTDNNPDYTLFVDSGYFYIYDQTAGATKFQITPSGNAINTGTLTSASFIKSGGTSSQFLMADGSVSAGVANTITGSLNTGYVPKATGANTLGNSLIYDNGSQIQIGTTSTNLIEFFPTANSPRLSIEGGASSNTQGVGANIRLYDSVNGRIWGVQMDVNYNYSFFAYNGSVYSKPIYFTQTGDATFGGTITGTNLVATNFIDSYSRIRLYFNSTGTIAAQLYENGASTNGGALELYGKASGTVDTVISAAPTQLNYINNAANFMIGYNTDILYKLGVNGAGYFNGSITSASNVIIPSGFEYVWGGGSVSILGNTSTNSLELRTNNTTQFSIASDGRATFQNSVGIASAPVSGISLYIKGSSVDSPLLRMDGLNYTIAQLGDTTTGTTDVGSLLLYNQGTLRVRMSSNTGESSIINAGNVLIGTTTDAGYKLDVNGGGRFVGGLIGSTAYFTANNGILILTSPSSTGYSSTTYVADGRSYVTGVGGTLAGVTATRNSFYIYDGTADALRFYISSTGIATFSNEVKSGSWFEAPNNYGLTIRNAANTAGRVVIKLNTSNQIEVGRDSDISAIRFGTASTLDAAIITSAGNLGVGILDPQQKIQTGGRIRVSPDNSNGGDLGVNDGGLAISAIGAAPIQFWRSNYASISMMINSSGQLLIGPYTGTPAAPGRLFISRSDQYGMTLDAGNGYGRVTTTDDFLYLRAGGTDRLTISSSFGYVATSDNFGVRRSPTVALDVNGTTNGINLETNVTAVNAVTPYFTILESGVSRTMTGYTYDVTTPLAMIITQTAETTLGLWRASDNATGSTLRGMKSRGTGAAPISPNNGDVLFSVEGWAIHGAGPNYPKFGGGMRFVKDDAFGTANTVAPARTEFVNAFNTTSSQITMTILPNGNVTALGSMTSTSFFESSDFRLKTLINDNPIIHGIENLQAKLYEKNGKIELGYFAQDAEIFMPYAVTKNADGFLNLSYREVHTAKIARLEKEVAELKAQLNLN